MNSLLTERSFKHGQITEMLLAKGLVEDDVPIEINSGQMPCDMYLGMSFLRNYVVSIDFDNYKIGMSKYPSRSEALSLKLGIVATPFLVGFVNGMREHRFLLDTGAPCLVVLGKTFEDELPVAHQPFTVKDGSFSVRESSQGKLPWIKFPSLNLFNVKTIFLNEAKSSQSNNDILGLDFLRLFHKVILDFPNSKMILDSSKTSLDIDCSNAN
jgi:hypothetical protein